jgi:NAD(P)-dependent dehydrogenase (short-subunit alcohol dehydrogenase family)
MGQLGLTICFLAHFLPTLLLTVNYLSHFLLTEKLLPLLKQSSKPKILQVSSSFHWAVDGSDLRRTNEDATDIVASQPGGSHGFLVYRSQRQYANSKLAQILHARSLQRQNITAVSACPAWVGTQIVAKQGSLAHRFFSNVAFPVHGFGLSSILNALFDTPQEKKMDYYVNTALMGGSNPMDQMPAWMYKALPLRDVFCFLFSLVALQFQRFFPVRQTNLSSRVSYQEDLQDELYRWSREAVAEWL